VSASHKTEFEALISRNYAALHRFVTRRVSNSASAEDILQEALCDAYRSLDTFRGDAQLIGWVFGILSNKVHGHYRREGVTSRTTVSDEALLDAMPSTDEGPSEKLHGTQQIQRLAELLAALPPDLRVALWDVAVDGVSYEEVARTRGIPIGTLRSRLSRARAKIKHALEHDGK
jgi:RNA polymerase sigma factor (sigma-70 family)